MTQMEPTKNRLTSLDVDKVATSLKHEGDRAYRERGTDADHLKRIQTAVNKAIDDGVGATIIETILGRQGLCLVKSPSNPHPDGISAAGVAFQSLA